MNKLRVVSLFSGCGGMDLGFIEAGFNVIWANEISSEFTNTYKLNVGNHIVAEDIKKIDIKSIPDADIVIGGPPCQSFSLIGKRDPRDSRSSLVWNFLEVVKIKKPRVFVMENVLGLRSAKDENGTLILPILTKAFQSLGYTVNQFILNAADYGVPQQRKRLFLVGSIEDKSISAPTPTHSKDTKQHSIGKKLEPWVTALHAIGDLPKPSTEKDEVAYEKDAKTHYQTIMRKGNGKTIKNHQMPYMSETDMRIIKSVPPGGNYMDVPDDIATKRIKNFKKTGGRTTTYGRLDPRKPAYTINTHFSRPNVGCNIHFKENRLITIREGLRLQSFPDSFVVLSNSKRGEYIQVGNAVPPLLAKALALHILKFIK